ncbi:hypothetical protein [Tenacibaculum ascidiaceicola]|uniref:hypothetical protein n=1 Tax=Tenacibaculum ascidiaceicola TaxID=1699411 RepID=UPI003CE4FEE8
MEQPILLLKKELINPIEQALDRIEKIRQRKMNNEDSIILEGLFALGVASFEHSIIDTLRTLLNYIPDKLDVKSESISKQQLIDGNPLEQAIENKVNSVSYKNLPDIISYFTKISGIPENIVTEDELADLIEIKATRNLLIHNNLIVNSFYKETAGAKARQGQGNRHRLVINQDYLFESLVIMRSVLRKFKRELNLKYKDFTKIKAMKSLFAYIFQTPVMKFENEFDVDEDRDVISNLKPETSMKGNLSSSETLFYNIWVAHSHGNKFEFDRGYFYGLDKRNRKKMAYLIEQLDILKS